MKKTRTARQKIILLATVVLIGMMIPGLSFSGERFTDNGDGTVTDTRTGLMWSARDNGGDATFATADIGCRESTLAGHDDWRLPDIKELKKLYEPEEKNSQGYGISDRITITGCCQWSSYDSTGVSSLLDFRTGKEIWSFKTDSEDLRYLQVRGTK